MARQKSLGLVARLVILFAAVALGGLPVCAQEAADARREADPISLFNGRDLDGWVVLGGLARTNRDLV